MSRILLIVEGDGEVEAAPVLARRVLRELYGIYNWSFETHRRRDIAHLKANQWANFRRYLEAAFIEGVPILWMLDCDDGCVIELVREMQTQARNVSIRQPLAFCMWVKEYETMFLYDPACLRQRLAIPDFQAPVKPDGKRGVKEPLNSQMPSGRCYKERLDQPALSAKVDLGKLQSEYRSFQHFAKSLHWLVHQNMPDLYPLRS